MVLFAKLYFEKQWVMLYKWKPYLSVLTIRNKIWELAETKPDKYRVHPDNRLHTEQFIVINFLNKGHYFTWVHHELMI